MQVISVAVAYIFIIRCHSFSIHVVSQSLVYILDNSAIQVRMVIRSRFLQRRCHITDCLLLHRSLHIDVSSQRSMVHSAGGYMTVHLDVGITNWEYKNT